jgi:hypothetical protein
MSVHDEMSDTEVLRAAAKSLSALPMASPPDVAAIMARGRMRRRHRISGAAGVLVAAAGTALVLGLTGVLGPASALAPATIRTASFTLVSNANGTATLTINVNELLDAAALQNDLHQDGVPAMVTSGSFCSSDPAPAGFSQVVSFDSQPSTSGFAQRQKEVHPTITFRPAAMPAGTELSFGVFQLSSGRQQADFELINTSSYTCTNTPPPTLDNGAQFQVGPAGPAESATYSQGR